MARELIIEGRGINKVFQVGGQILHVLKGIDLQIPAGQFVGIRGPSGSGKSTLLYLIGGLDRPSDGQMTVAGKHLDGMTSDELAAFRRLTVGFVFQSFHLVPTMTALENVALPGIFAGVPRDVREARAARLLTMLTMRQRADHRPSQLSGGQQQRVAIARALFNNPPIIMADEPTGSLDSKTGQTVMQLLRWLCTKQGRTIVVVTHNPGIARYADRILELKDGRIVDDQLTDSRGKHDVA